jgi:hypothetical protein
MWDVSAGVWPMEMERESRQPPRIFLMLAPACKTKFVSTSRNDVTGTDGNISRMVYLSTRLSRVIFTILSLYRLWNNDRSVGRGHRSKQGGKGNPVIAGNQSPVVQLAVTHFTELPSSCTEHVNGNIFEESVSAKEAWQLHDRELHSKRQCVLERCDV